MYKGFDLGRFYMEGRVNWFRNIVEFDVVRNRDGR